MDTLVIVILTQALVLQIAQRRSYLYTLRPKEGIIYILGAMGKVMYAQFYHHDPNRSLFYYTATAT